MKKHKILNKQRLMKNTTSIISILVVALLVFSSAVSATTSSKKTVTINEKITRPLQQGIADVSPNIDLITPSEFALNQQGTDPQTMDLWDLVFEFDVAAASGAAGNTGSAFMGDYWYSCRWASNLHHQYDIDGALLKQYSIGGVSGCRDYAMDEDYLYAGASGGTIWGWDPIGETLEVTITGGFQARACTYNSEDDTFFCSNWGDPVWEVNRDGDIVDSFDLALTTSTYGFAYDPWGADGPFMWVYDQGGSGAEIHQWDLANGEFTGVEHNTIDDIGAVIAGGLEATGDFEEGEFLLNGLGQGNGAPDTMFVYDIDTLTELPEHDVAVKAITSPTDMTAIENIPMKCVIKNTGNNTETFDAQMEIIKCEGSGEDLLNENFSGSFPPAGWTTDWWKQGSGSNAGGLAPEAMCYYYDQYYSGGVYHYDYYDNYIMSPQVNCSGLEKINLYFAFAADISSNCYMYLKYRKNSTSSWKDVTPWDVPITEDFQDWFEIGCYGFQTGGDIGDEFQFQLEYLGYYSYFRYWYLDDCRMEPCGGCAEYADIVEDITLEKGEELEVEFPTWTPTEWQNESTENTFQEYPIHAFTLLEGDEVQKNNEKWTLVEIYFPWMDDVAAIDFIGAETGPAQTFDMTSVITNVGQNDECCFKTHVGISEIDYNNPITIFTENFDSGNGYTEPTGWTTGASQTYAWYCYYYSYYLPAPYGGGRSMRCYWYYSAGAELISPEFDSSSAGSLEATWGMFYDHFSGDYELYVDVRPDPSAFWGEIQPWDNPVTSNMGPEWYTGDATTGVGTQTQIRFRTGGYYYNMDYWYFDNLEFIGYDVKEPEFAAEVCVESISPGDELEFDFGEWTPEFLAEETTGQITYILRTWTNLEDPPDKDPSNDLYQIPVILDFYHDVGVQDITSPSETKAEEIIFSQVPIASGGHGPFSDAGTAYRCYENFWDLDAKIGGVHWWGLCGYGSGVPQAGMTFQVAFCEDNGGVPDYTNHIYEQDGTLGTDITFEGTGVFYFGYELFYFTMDLEENIDLEEGWVSFYKTSVTSEVFAMIDAEIGSGDGQAYQAGVGTILYDLAFELVKGGLSVDVYVSLGSQNIDAVVENIGTFPELDLVCYAEIYEFITNCTVGTLVYEDNISDIDLDVPLVGTETLNFDSYNFATEGFYGLFLDIPDEDDDFPKNNLFDMGIGADDTPPTSIHTLDPATPDGDNGWYVSNVEVTVDAADPTIGCDVAGSGVQEIKYKIGGGTWQTIPGDHGTFTIDTDDENLAIEYYSVDNVGNEEAHNSFQIDMDQTVPDIEEVTWESFQDPPVYGLWYVTFTCDAVDATSGMDRVEMFINDGEHEIITGAGPTYEFTIEWSEAFRSCTFWFYHYDVAGNMIEDFVPGEDPISYANYQQQQSNPISKQLANQ